MKKLGIGLGAFICGLVVIMVLANRLVSSEAVMDTVTENVAKNTGRSLRINGETELSLFPALVVELNDVEFSNAHHGTEPNMASMSMLSLHIPWTSVFKGKLVIDKFVIDELNLTLEKSRNGEPNWEMGPGKSTERAGRQQNNNTPGASESKGGFPDSFDVSLGDVEIRSGSFTFLDHEKDTIERVTDLSLAIVLPSLRQPLQLNGSLTYKNQAFKIQTILDNPIKLLNGETFDTDLSLESNLVNMQYDGEVQQTPLKVTGELSVNGDSVKEILSWQGTPMLAKEEAFNQFSLQASIAMTEGLFNLDALNFQLDELDIKGQSTVEFTGTPKITANINLGALNVNPYLPETVETQQPPPLPPPATEKAPIQWDDTEMDLSGLSAANVDLKVVSESFTFQDIKLGKNQLSLRLNNGLMELGLDEFNAYQGTGKGKVTLNSARKPYQIATDFDLNGIDFQPLLTDAAGFDKLMGRGQVKWQLTTRGVSQKDFVSALSGALNFEVKDGAVQGANIAAIAKSAESIISGDIASVNLDQNFNDAEKTDFASLSGNLNFRNGVMSTNDILLLNPFVRVSVTGSVDLPAASTNLRASTKLVASAQGQGANDARSGITIPMKITGPFHDVKIRPDLEALIKKKLEDGLKDKITDKLKGLFGG